MSSRFNQPHSSETHYQDFVNKRVRVKFIGGREVVGIMKEYDRLFNIVLEDAVEYLRSLDDPYVLSGESRYLGQVICRSPHVSVVSDEDLTTTVENPFE